MKLTGFFWFRIETSSGLVNTAMNERSVKVWRISWLSASQEGFYSMQLIISFSRSVGLVEPNVRDNKCLIVSVQLQSSKALSVNEFLCIRVEGGAWSGTGGKVAVGCCDYSSVTIQTSQRGHYFASPSYFICFHN